MQDIQSKFLPAGSVVQVGDLSHRSVEQAAANALRSPQPVQIVFRSPWQHTSEQLREERRFEQRARRLRDRANREGWISSELTTAINNGCRIGRVTAKNLTDDTIPERAWRFFIDVYFSPLQPSLIIAYRGVLRMASEHGWGEIPSIATFRRRLKRVITGGRDA